MDLDEESDRILSGLAQEHQGDRGRALAELLQAHKTRNRGLMHGYRYFIPAASFSTTPLLESIRVTAIIPAGMRQA